MSSPELLYRMLQLIGKSAIALILLGSFLPYDSSEAKSNTDRRPGSEFFNEELAKVSYGLALLAANARVTDEAECAVLRLLHQDNPVDQQVEKKEWCVLYEQIAKDTKELAEKALQSKVAPSEGFLFYAWRYEGFVFGDDKETKEGAYKLGKLRPGPHGEAVGLFKTLESCQVAEDRVRKLDDGTRPCRSWKESWFAQAQPEKEIPEEAFEFRKVFGGVLGTLLSAGVLIWVYKLARNVYESAVPKTRGQKAKEYLHGAVIVAGLSVMVWALYGTHFESDDDDPLHGSGQYVQDFKPTNKERNEHGLKVFLTLLAPVWLGTKHAHDGVRKIL